MDGTNVTPKKLNNAMTVIDEVVAGLVEKKVQECAIEKITEDVKKCAIAFIKNEYGTVEKRVVLHVDDGRTIEIKGVLHTKFDEVLAYAIEGEPVFITGQAGSGKNVLCQQVADAMGLEFYFTNAVTQEYKLTGFTDANGVYHESQFYKAFKNGGLFMFDEMDGSCAEALLVVNSALANGYFDFPAPIGRINAHKDFRVIGAGNTYGTGATFEYVGRTQLDGATLDRFAIVEVQYDRGIEMAMCDGNEELVDFIHEFREACRKAGIKKIASYRAIRRISKMEDKVGIVNAVYSGLTKGMSQGDKDMICNNIENKSNKYFKAFKGE